MAHQVSYEHFVGPIPLLANGRRTGLDHFICDTPECVNWEHVRLASSRENTLRGDGPSAMNAAKTHCPQGHPFDEANTWVDKTGRRHCRACTKARSLAWHRENGAEYMRNYTRRKNEGA